jgi:hypothetical protein
MTRHITLIALALTSLLAAGHAASAQVVAYDHRSTVWGDHLAGASELVRAQGSFLRDYADSTETLVRAQAAHDDLMYQRAEYRFQLRQMYDQYLRDKAETNRQRDAAHASAEDAAALSLWQRAQRGFVAWPVVLKQDEFANSMTLIESILRNWSPANPSADAYRRALATEAGVLKARIELDKTIAFNARVDAVRTLSRLQRLAEMTGIEGPQLAMR